MPEMLPLQNICSLERSAEKEFSCDFRLLTWKTIWVVEWALAQLHGFLVDKEPGWEGGASCVAPGRSSLRTFQASMHPPLTPLLFLERILNYSMNRGAADCHDVPLNDSAATKCIHPLLVCKIWMTLVLCWERTDVFIIKFIQAEK